MSCEAKRARKSQACVIFRSLNENLANKPYGEGDAGPNDAENSKKIRRMLNYFATDTHIHWK